MWSLVYFTKHVLAAAAGARAVARGAHGVHGARGVHGRGGVADPPEMVVGHLQVRG